MNFKRGTGGNKGWGSSPRPTAEDLPDWARDFQGPGWAATPNPEAVASKKQRKAVLYLVLMLAPLPVSLLSCVIALGAGSGSSTATTPVTVVTAPPATDWSPTRTDAEIAAQRWLRTGGVEAAGWAWRDSRTSLLPCFYNFPCEEHLFAVELEKATADGRDRVLLAITIDPATGSVAGVSMLDEDALEEEEQETEDGDEPEDPPDRARPVWSDSREEPESGLPAGHMDKIVAWASAWATRDTTALAELAGDATPTTDAELNAAAESIGVFALASRWWKLHPPGGVEVVSLVSAGLSGDLYIATVAFSLAEECSDIAADTTGGPPAPLCSECSTRSTAQNLCDGRLDMTADLLIEADRQHIYVLESSHVGGLDPDDPLPEADTGEGA